MRLGGVFSGDGVGTSDEHAVVPSIIDGVGVGPADPACSLLAAAAAADEFSIEVTSIMNTRLGSLAQTPSVTRQPVLFLKAGERKRVERVRWASKPADCSARQGTRLRSMLLEFTPGL